MIHRHLRKVSLAFLITLVGWALYATSSQVTYAEARYEVNGCLPALAEEGLCTPGYVPPAPPPSLYPTEVPVLPGFDPAPDVPNNDGGIFAPQPLPPPPGEVELWPHFGGILITTSPAYPNGKMPIDSAYWLQGILNQYQVDYGYGNGHVNADLGAVNQYLASQANSESESENTPEPTEEAAIEATPTPDPCPTILDELNRALDEADSAASDLEIAQGNLDAAFDIANTRHGELLSAEAKLREATRNGDVQKISDAASAHAEAKQASEDAEELLQLAKQAVSNARAALAAAIENIKHWARESQANKCEEDDQ